MAQKVRRSVSSRLDIIHLGRGKRPYRVERGEHGEFKSIKGPADAIAQGKKK